MGRTSTPLGGYDKPLLSFLDTDYHYPILHPAQSRAVDPDLHGSAFHIPSWIRIFQIFQIKSEKMKGNWYWYR